MEAYFVECRTGCSCCSSENHSRGPFSTKEIAEARVVAYRGMSLLASQFARSGVYVVEECDEIEALPDGRLIIDDHVYRGFVDAAAPGSPGELKP